jgi:hypothetical protein
MINNDQEFKKVLAELSVAEQRELGAQFVSSVIALNSDPLIARALEIASDKTYSTGDFNEYYKRIKSLSVKTYTSCGDDADWTAQAAHFVVTAAKVCLTPEEQLGDKNNLAWKCAMQSRMAQNCAMIESDEDILNNEAQKQYAITNDYLSD